MKPLRVLATCLALTGLVASASADDLNPPDWRTNPPGQGTTTMQAWEFGTDANPAAPDIVFNQFGDPSATITGEWPLTLWKADNFGHSGVWRFEDWMDVYIPNNPDPLDTKLIWLQVTFSAADGANPEIVTTPEWASLETIETIQLDDYYYHGTYLITIEPNPPDEHLIIMPRDCTLYVDEIVVDTWCIPEPSSLALLSLAGLLVRRRR